MIVIFGYSRIVIKEDPKNKSLINNRNLCYIHDDQYDLALKSIKSDPEMTFEIAYCHLQLGEFDKSLDSISKLDPDNLSTLYLIAQIVLI